MCLWKIIFTTLFVVANLHSEEMCLAPRPPFSWDVEGKPCCWTEPCSWSCIHGYWFPEEPALYKTMLADPRQICYSLGWRFDDQALHKDIIDISLGDTLALYEWCNVFFRHSLLRVEIEGAVWAVFSPKQESAPLVNADYYVGIPITYALGPWSFRLRLYHISSHIGDEYLLMHPDFDRRNPSAEYVDFFASYDLSEDFRFFGGIGYAVSQDDHFQCSPLFGAFGVDVRLRSMFGIDWYNELYGTPFYGMYFRFSKDFKNHFDATYVLGYEWGKLSGLYRKVRVFFEYHDGYSLEGQFCKFPTNYLSLRASYGF